MVGNSGSQSGALEHIETLPQIDESANLTSMKLLHSALFAILLSNALTACGGFGMKEDHTKKWSAQRLYESAKEARKAGDYETAIDYYQKLESRYPFGPYAQQAQLDLIYTYYKFDEPASALAAADRFIKLHPRHPHIDYVYYLKGLTSFNQGKGFVQRIVPHDISQRDQSTSTQAFQDFDELIKRFPNSKYSKDAKQRMLYLRNNMAKHELHVARYYMSRGAYVAAANRARYVVENYQTTPSVTDALVLMAEAYTILKLDDLADDALRVLALNYPNHPVVKDKAGLTLKN